MVKCNFKKFEMWDVVGAPYWDHKYDDYVGNIEHYSGNVCLMKSGKYLCDEENCIFFRKEKQNERFNN